MPSRVRSLWATAAAGVVLLAVFHPLVLRGCARLLVVDQPLPESASHVLLCGGDRQFDRAAELLASGRCRGVLIQAGLPDRLAYLGILPTWTELCRRELGRRGVPDERLTVQETAGQRSWDGVRALGDWLMQHPDARLILLVDRFASGGLAYILRQTLRPEHVERVALCALPDRRYDETNWWRSRTGLKAFLTSVLNRVTVRLCGEQRKPPYDPDPEAYERKVLRSSSVVRGTTRNAASSKPHGNLRLGARAGGTVTQGGASLTLEPRVALR